MIKIQKNLGIKKKSITRLSDTRWNCRYKNCEAVMSSYKAILSALRNEIENESDKDVNEALGKYFDYFSIIVSIILHFQFYFSVFIHSTIKFVD